MSSTSLRWRHLVNACWQNLGAVYGLFLAAFTLWLNLFVVLSCVRVCMSCHCCPAWQTVVCSILCVRLSGLS